MEPKFALIIGGSGGIGLETAKNLSGQGIKVGITYHKNESKLKQELNKHKFENYFLYPLNLTDEESIKETIFKILQEHEKIDIVIHCATTPVINRTVFDLDWQEFQQHLEVQIKGLFVIIKSLSPLIQKNHKIKFISVLTEYCFGKPPPQLSHYVTAKYGLMGFMRSMASELTANGCTFNMVSPGMVDTALLDDLHPRLREITSFKNPLKRIAKPSDVAETISFLVSEKADYLNGVNIPINGGNVLM